MYKLSLHAIFAFLLLVAAASLLGCARTDPVLSAIDVVQLYIYTKAPINVSAATFVATQGVSTATVAQGVNLLGSDPNLCRDMSKWTFPTVAFRRTPVSLNNPNCSAMLSFTVGWQIGSAGYIIITSVNGTGAVGCIPGVYNLSTVGGTLATGGVALSAGLIIAGTTANPVFILDSNGLGGPWAVQEAPGSHYAACVDERKAVATQINGNMSCQHESSQMCTCLYAFTTKFINLSARFPSYSDPANNNLPNEISDAISSCSLYRRRHDVRAPAPGGAQSLSQLLFIAVLALFLNTLLAIWHDGETTTTGTQAEVFMYLLPYFGVVFLLIIVGHVSALSSWRLFLIMWAPGMCLGLYNEVASRVGEVHQRTYLHPFVFDICLGCLAMYTLLKRGVVQSELLEAELWCVHGTTCVYMAVTWFYVYTREVSIEPAATSEKRGKLDNSNAIMGTVYIQEACVLLVCVGLAMGCASLIIPYPTLNAFEGHWLLPGLFTLVAFGHLCWLGMLSLRHQVQVTKGNTKTIEYFNDIGAFMLLGVVSLFFFSIFTTHMQVYGTTHASPFPIERNMAPGAYSTGLVQSLAVPGFVRTIMPPGL